MSSPRSARPSRSPLRALCATALAILSSQGAVSAQDLGIKAPPRQLRPLAIVNATVHPVSAPDIAQGFVFITDGKVSGIGSVGEMAAGAVKGMESDGWTVIDATGKHVYPGLIAAYTQMGLTEINAVRATLDFNEVGGISPEVRTVVAVNPDSTLVPVTRANGVLICGVFPGPGGGGLLSYFGGSTSPMPGRAGVIRMEGWTWEDMTIDADSGVVINWPFMRTVRAAWMDREDEDQGRDIAGKLATIAGAFDSAKSYIEAKAANPATPTDLRWEALRPALAGQRPVFLVAEDYDQIVSAVTFAADRGLKSVIVGGLDAPLCADLLKRTNTPVIVTGTIRFPKRDDSDYDEAFTLPARLEAAGVKWCLSSGEDTAHERNLPYAAALAAAYGLEPRAALRSITLSAAEVLGVADRVGSIDIGKAGTVIITDGNPLEITTRVQRAFIDGREIDLSSKQSKLAEKYREKYRQQKEAAGTRK